MKVAQISLHYKPIVGGQEVYVSNLQRVLLEQGHVSRVYQPNRRVAADDMVSVARVPFVPRFVKNFEIVFFNLMLALSKGKSLSEEDLIIVHYAFHSLPVWRLKSKVIVLSHGIEWNVDRKKIIDKISNLIAGRALKRFVTVANDTHYFRNFGLDVHPGTRMFTEVLPGKWFIPNCVDTEQFRKTDEIPELAAQRCILVPRQITEDRGILLAIEAFSQFLKRNPGFSLLIIGKPTTGAYFDRCVQLTKHLGLENKATFLGFVKHAEIPRYYSSAVLTLIPTLRREGTSLSALESMSCGTPTVSTNVAGLRDLPTVQADPDPHALAAAMESTLAKRKEVSLSQQRIVQEVFNSENWRTAWLKVIEAASARQVC